MSTYWYAACHDCRVYTECSNAGAKVAEEMATKWFDQHHDGHVVEVMSEYHPNYEYLVTRGLRIVGESQFGEYPTEREGEPYKQVERE